MQPLPAMAHPRSAGSDDIITEKEKTKCHTKTKPTPKLFATVCEPR
jgi:hypothetical protein